MAATPAFPPVPTNREDLLIAALRHANKTAKTLNEIRDEVASLLGKRSQEPQYDCLHDLLLKGFFDDSAVFLFVAANNLQIDLPADLKGDSTT